MTLKRISLLLDSGNICRKHIRFRVFPVLVISNLSFFILTYLEETLLPKLTKTIKKTVTECHGSLSWENNVVFVSAVLQLLLDLYLCEGFDNVAYLDVVEVDE